jgi:rhomboid domain-containing protein 1
MGSGAFLKMTFILMVLTNLIAVAAAYVLSSFIPEYAHYYYGLCAFGFSGVLFALKVIVHHTSPGIVSFFGFFTVPTKYAAWVELGLMQLMGHTSLLLHVSGILAGYMYIKR